MNSTPLLNRAAVKKLAIEMSKQNRAGKFSRVSQEFLIRINSKLNLLVRAEVQAHPSIGKTLQ